MTKIQIKVPVRCFHLLLVLSIALGTVLSRATPVVTENYSAPIRVACVGDSITDGFGVGRDWAYPGQLGRMLGPKWWVLNYGATGTTMVKAGNDPYWAHDQFVKAHEFMPDVVIIALGTNDTKEKNWVHKEDFLNDYGDMIASFQALPSKPLIYLCLPPPVTDKGNMGIPPEGPSQTGPMISQLAQRTSCSVIDFYAALVAHPEWQPDHIHPDPLGAFALAKTVYAALTGKNYEGNMILITQAPKPLPQPEPGK